MNEHATRRDYKDRLFRFIFGSEERKEYTLELYNALNGSNYANPDELELTTIDDVLYLGMKNDLSFVIDRRMSLIEQQSTYNPNMPVRGLMYFGKLYDSYIAVHDLEVYGTELIKLPTPRYVVFYNGEKTLPARTTLRLSDAFDFPEESDVNVTATMININSNAGDEMLMKCRTLMEYATFIARVRKKQAKGIPRDKAITETIDECIDENILHDILLAHKSEVTEMVLTEFDAEKHDRHIKEQGQRIGRAEERNRNKSLALMMKRDGRQEEYFEALEDDARLDRLYEEYGLSES